MKGFVSSSAAESSSNNSLCCFEQATGIRSKLHAIGRLDADTTGLLLLTNDGGLVHHVTNPNAPTHIAETGAITKTYEALIMGHHTEDTLSSLWEGVDIGAKYGGMTRPVHDLNILDHPNHKSTVVSLTISEGKNRQVRRMFHALGSGVMKLKRTNVGNHLTLKGLEEGEWRILSNQEVLDSLHWEPRDIDRLHLAKKKKFPRDTDTDMSQSPSKTSKFSKQRARRRRRG
jgi:pseudouridine synthase